MREYDPIIERWTTVDPKRIGWSPYIGMFNNPVNAIDPDGGGPGDDMEFEYAQAMQQMDINLYDQLQTSVRLDEVVVVSFRFDTFTPVDVAPVDATQYVVNVPGGTLSTLAGYELYIYSSEGGPGGRGSYTPGTDPAAEGFDLSFLLENYDGRSEDQHGLIEDDQKDNKMDFTRYDTLISTDRVEVYKLRTDGSLRRTYIHDIHRLDKRTGDTLQTRKNVEID